MEYQNERGNRFYGIEFSYFVSPEGTQCLLPQLVVAPPIKSQPAARDENRILEAAGRHRDLILRLKDAAATEGAETKPATDFISVIARDKRGGVTPLYLSANAANIATVNPGEILPDGPFLAAGQQLEQQDLGVISQTGKSRRLPYDRIPAGKEGELVRIITDLFAALLGSPTSPGSSTAAGSTSISRPSTDT